MPLMNAGFILQLYERYWLGKVEDIVVIQRATRPWNLHVEEKLMLPETQWRQVFAMPGDVRDRASRRLLLAYWEKIMNSNDSPKHRQEIYWDYAFAPSIYVCHCRVLSAQPILGGAELMVSPCALIQHLIMRKKSYFISSHVWGRK